MSTLQFSLVRMGDEECITIFVPGGTQPLVAVSSHPNFAAIKAYVADPPADAEFEDVEALFDVTSVISRRFEPLTERISTANGEIFVDGEPAHGALVKQILAFLDAGTDEWEPLVKFFEKLLTNPQEHSRDQLYEWLVRHDVTITQEGDIVFYKGVQKNEDGSLVSVHAGPAIVDGEEVDGQVPNEVGSTIEMARGSVRHDPSVGCSTGLHVANWRYANSWARGAVLEVHVNPRDVVSVPTDSDYEKVRCCRYKVVQVLDAPYSAPVLPVDGSREDDDYFVSDDVDLDFDDDDRYDD